MNPASAPAGQKIVYTGRTGDHKPMVMKGDADNNTYGYSSKDPICLNNAGHENMAEQFLASLSGPDGEPIRFGKIGECCPFSVRTRSKPVYLSTYQVTYKGLSAPVVLYFNAWEGFEPIVPYGFTPARKEMVNEYISVEEMEDLVVNDKRGTLRFSHAEHAYVFDIDPDVRSEDKHEAAARLAEDIKNGHEISVRSVDRKSTRVVESLALYHGPHQERVHDKDSSGSSDTVTTEVYTQDVLRTLVTNHQAGSYNFIADGQYYSYSSKTGDPIGNVREISGLIRKLRAGTYAKVVNRKGKRGWGRRISKITVY
ncbi:MAG: hypothetical protein A3G34_05690 [Candidatus Lindowbacteria bacterium RIFCSPLOWO2_12_FULL_62_27]|nr:MAG: hypothetical protein A3G34_05690 [Candidatus Lindowbacteria bacterium RIFCSPLOWO2_12_FULL_62_27]